MCGCAQACKCVEVLNVLTHTNESHVVYVNPSAQCEGDNRHKNPKNIRETWTEQVIYRKESC